MATWWLSFCDTDKPAGTQFLGVCVIQADDIEDAAQMAWRLGINPGGQIMGFEMFEDTEIKPEHFNRLLQRGELIASGYT